MPRWTDGLVDAFPIPVDPPTLSLAQLKINDDDAAAAAAAAASNTQPGEARPQPVQEEEQEQQDTDPLRFFDLPAELRNRIYTLVLFSRPGYRGASGRRKGSRLAILLASRRFHAEAAYTLYTSHKFLIFPIQLFTPLPTIQELPLHYRVLVTNLEMVVGSSWTSPPKSWKMTKGLARCLGRLANVQTLAIFVDFDPSHPAFKRYRISYEFYTDFCGELLEDVLEAMPQLKYVQLDGNSGVDLHGPLVARLRGEAEAQSKTVKYGREAGWAHKASENVAKEATNYDDS